MYHETLHDALEERVISFVSSKDVILRTGVLNLIESYFQKHFDTLTLSPSQSSAAVHLANLQQFKEKWSLIYSDKTCLCCVSQAPQYRFPCGHLVCETCVQVFGKQKRSEPWIYRVNSCFLCMTEWAEEVIVTVKAPTRGVSILCLDGGGTRAIVPLTVMKRIQERTGISLPIQKYFKLVAGVSSGDSVPQFSGIFEANMF